MNINIYTYIYIHIYIYIYIYICLYINRIWYQITFNETKPTNKSNKLLFLWLLVSKGSWK